MKKYIKSSLQITDDIIYDIFDEYWLLDSYELPDYVELEEEYGIDREEYGRIISFFDELDKKFESGEIETYREHNGGYGGELFLQLSDRHVFWDFDTEYILDEDYVSMLIDIYVTDFSHYMGVEVYLLGRSNRHVCVPFTLDNILKYDKLKNEWEKCEEHFVEDINNGGVL